MFIAGVRMRYLMGLFAASLPVIYFMIVRVGYRMGRITAFLDPWNKADTSGFQLVQSFIAFGSGGVWGKGLGEGVQKLFFLPEAHTDFILPVIGEELGFIGVSIVLFLYLFILWAGIKTALEAPDLFGTHLAIGIVIMIVLQAVMNMGVVTGLLPPKGLTLPFISYGGTSLLIDSAAVGILLNIYGKGRET